MYIACITDRTAGVRVLWRSLGPRNRVGPGRPDKLPLLGLSSPTPPLRLAHAGPAGPLWQAGLPAGNQTHQGIIHLPTTQHCTQTRGLQAFDAENVGPQNHTRNKNSNTTRKMEASNGAEAGEVCRGGGVGRAVL